MRHFYFDAVFIFVEELTIHIMKTKIIIGTIALALIAAFSFGFMNSQPKSGDSTNPMELNEAAGEPHINWISMEEAAALANENPKKILVDVYTDWCGWCKRMDRDAYEKASVTNYINENYYAVKFDAEQKEDITLGGKTFKFVANGRRGYHELAAAMLNGRLSYPHTVFFDETLQKIAAIPGYRPEKELFAMLNYFHNNVYKSDPNLDAYIQKFNSSGK